MLQATQAQNSHLFEEKQTRKRVARFTFLLGKSFLSLPILFGPLMLFVRSREKIVWQMNYLIRESMPGEFTNEELD